LLPRCRQDIYENKKLNFNLFLALKRSCHKPSAFYKGIILPLLEEDDVTLKEAIIFSSIIKKKSLPILHSRYL
jgi:essential nuclear protein 1